MTACIVLATLILPDSSVGAWASFRDRVPTVASAWNLADGSGAEYEADSGRSVRTFLTLSVVGHEQFTGKRAYWVEITSRLENSNREWVNKALLTVDSQNVTIPTAITQLPGRPPMTVPSVWMSTWARGELALMAGYIEFYGWGSYALVPVLRGPDACQSIGSRYEECYFLGLRTWPNSLPKAKDLGPDTVTTPAGTFACEHWRFNTKSEGWRRNPGPTDVWLAKDAGPFGIVRARTYDRVDYMQPMTQSAEMNLTRIVADAKDKITIVPQSAQPATLWSWLWQQRNDLVRFTLPQLGLPAISLPLSHREKF